MRVYLVVRLLAVVAFVLGVTVLPHGVPAGLVVMGAGLAALLSAVWSNAGARGERAGRPRAGPLVRLGHAAAGRLAAVRRRTAGRARQGPGPAARRVARALVLLGQPPGCSTVRLDP